MQLGDIMLLPVLWNANITFLVGRNNEVYVCVHPIQRVFGVEQDSTSITGVGVDSKNPEVAHHWNRVQQDHFLKIVLFYLTFI